MIMAWKVENSIHLDVVASMSIGGKLASPLPLKHQTFQTKLCMLKWRASRFKTEAFNTLSYCQSWISDTVVGDFQDDFLIDREAPVARYLLKRSLFFPVIERFLAL